MHHGNFATGNDQCPEILAPHAIDSLIQSSTQSDSTPACKPNPSDMTGLPIVLEKDYAAPAIAALFVGPWEAPEFAAAVSDVQQGQQYPRQASISEASRYLSEVEIAPELILLAQPLPAATTQTEVDRLQLLAPLARIVIVAGSWCEGELRTGHPPRGVLRLYWYELAPWWQAAHRRLATGRCPSWSLPLDHFQAGRFCADADLVALPPVVAVDAADYSVFETLADAIRQAGSTAVWAARNPDVLATAGIWDGGQLDDRELSRLRQFCRQVEGRVIALADFPRVEHTALARNAGAAAVFGKPYVVEEVLAALV